MVNPLGGLPQAEHFYVHHTALRGRSHRALNMLLRPLYYEYSLYSIFTSALKHARRIQRDDCDEVYDEDGWAKDCGFGMF